MPEAVVLIILHRLRNPRGLPLATTLGGRGERVHSDAWRSAQAVETCAVGVRYCAFTFRAARASARVPRWHRLLRTFAWRRWAILALGLICAIGGTSQEALASAGCNAVNAGQWNETLTDTTATLTGNFLAGDILHVSLNGGGTQGGDAIYEFSGSLQAGGGGELNGPVSYSFTAATSGSGSLFAESQGNSTLQFISTITCTPAPPVVTSISPTRGPTGSATTVTITGTSFTGATYISLPCSVFTSLCGGVNTGQILYGSVTPISDTEITATLPSGGSGTIDVIVETVTVVGSQDFFVAGTPTAADQFTYYTVPSANTAVSVVTLTEFESVSVTPVTGSGGLAPLTYSVSPGLPAGLSMNSATGAITGAPTVTSAARSYTVTVTDAANQRATAGFNLMVNAAVQPASAQDAYITNSSDNTVSVIATASNTVAATIPVGSFPTGVAVSPDGSTVYVANAADNTVSVIATASNTVTATIPVGSFPFGVAVTPDGSAVYVTNLEDNTVSVIATASKTVTATIPVGSGPRGVAVTPDGSTVYVTDYGGNTVSVIATASNTVTSTITVGNSPQGVAVTPDGSTVYVTNTGGNTVSVIATASNTVTSTITVGNSPQGVAVTPDGSTVYVANQSDFTVSAIATASNAVTATIPVGSVPTGLAVTPDGSAVYVANQGDNTVSVIATASNTVATIVVVRTNPVAFGSFIRPPPAVARISPASGPPGGGTSVTITGTDFTGATAVTFGGSAATQFTVNSISSITAIAPAGSGTVDVTVTNGLTSAANAADRFTYVPTLTLTSTASSATQVGQSYSQTNAAGGGTPSYTYSVSIGEPPAGTSLNTTTGTVSGTPTTAGAFSYQIKVTDSGSLTQTATQTVSGTIAPATLTLTATASSTTQLGQFYRQTNVASGGTTPYTYSLSTGTLPPGTTLSTSTGVVFGTPTAAGMFNYTIKVTDSGSPARTATQASNGVINPPAPTVTAVSPNRGSTAGGTSVTITGANLTGATAVSFGGVAATNVTVVSGTSITATSPAGNAGTVDVTVTTAGGTSATGAADKFAYGENRSWVSAVSGNDANPCTVTSPADTAPQRPSPTTTLAQAFSGDTIDIVLTPARLAR